MRRTLLLLLFFGLLGPTSLNAQKALDKSERSFAKINPAEGTRGVSMTNDYGKNGSCESPFRKAWVQQLKTSSSLGERLRHL